MTSLLPFLYNPSGPLSRESRESIFLGVQCAAGRSSGSPSSSDEDDLADALLQDAEEGVASFKK